MSDHVNLAGAGPSPSVAVEWPIRIEGPTPSGGVYALIFKVDEDRIEIVEFHADGRAIQRTYASTR